MQSNKINLVIPTTNINQRVVNLVKELGEKFNPEVQIWIVQNQKQVNRSGREKELTDLGVRVIYSEKGLGNALCAAYKHATSGTFAFIPDDIPFGFQEVELALKNKGKRNQLIVLSKYLVKTQVNWRQVQGRAFQIIVRTLFKVPVKDTQCSFIASEDVVRLFSKECVSPRYMITLENILVAKKSNVDISEVSAHWQENLYARKSTIKSVDKAIMILDMFKLIHHKKSIRKIKSIHH